MGGIFDLFEILKKELMVIAMAMLPVVELRGAIPFGMAYGLGLWPSFFLAYIGSMIPVPLLLFFLKPVMDFFRKTVLLRWFAEWVDNRTRRKSIKVRKYSLLGLFLFVAVPLPTTGVWTGSAIAAFLKIRMLHAIPVIALGNLTAGFIVTFISHQLI